VRPFRDVKSKLMVDAQKIIAALGTFDGLEFDPRLRYCPARYAARISQAFTATDSATMKVEEVIILPGTIHPFCLSPHRLIYNIFSRNPDISAASRKYDFTDGVGTMSLELAQDIWNQLQATRRRKRRVKNHPRALQIRFEGCKGKHKLLIENSL
jgi:RNA-dependent RNA polymerase